MAILPKPCNGLMNRALHTKNSDGCIKASDIMFIAKFTQVNADSERFETDKNGNMPYIGELLAGRSRGTLINGTMFERNDLKPNTLYVCENIDEEYEGKTQVRVQVISEISVMEFIALKKESEFKITKLEIADKVEADVVEPEFEA